MNFSFYHYNFNVLDLEKSLAFYQKALGFKEKRRLDRDAFTLVFLRDEKDTFSLELTHLKDRKEPYNLGEGEFHLAVHADDFVAAHALHEAMGCICYENKDMGIYFISDPDGYWIEIVPET